MRNKKKTILLVGGGSGGHITPILNIYSVLKRQSNLNVVVVGGTTLVDEKLYAGIENHIKLLTGKLHRALTLENLFQFLCLIWGLGTSLKILKKKKPNLIFSKAGYVSLPIIFWAKVLKIPYFIHESDIEMGSANKYASKGATKIFVGFPKNNYKIDKDLTIYTGQILSPNMLAASKDDFDFGFSHKKPVIFITGGSQGSRNINNAIFKSLPLLLSHYNIIHHTGSLDYEKAIEIRSNLNKDDRYSYFISALLTKTADGTDMMKSAIAQSRVVISRASATTLAEISIFKKPMIIIPYKYAASDHQAKNAIFYKKNHAAIIIGDDDLDDKILISKIDFLFKNPDEMKKIGQNAFDLLPRDGLSIITDEITKFLNEEKCEEV